MTPPDECFARLRPVGGNAAARQSRFHAFLKVPGEMHNL
jgi:hypothetical protein